MLWHYTIVHRGGAESTLRSELNWNQLRQNVREEARECQGTSEAYLGRVPHVELLYDLTKHTE